MPTYTLQLTAPRPYFAEIPYYLWGQVNYDSEGDCKTPTDRNWSWLELTNRETREGLVVAERGDRWEVGGDDPAAARAARFLQDRCGAVLTAGPLEESQGNDWDHARARARARRVEETFERPELKPFAAGHFFWGSWKWIGWFGTEFTWVGRWIMLSVLTNDRRAVPLCIHWLQRGTVGEPQSVALRYALQRLTGLSFATDDRWVRWYQSGKGQRFYPQPDIQAWYAELKAAEEAAEQTLTRR